MISYKKFCGYEGYKYHDKFETSSNHSLLSENICRFAWSPIVWSQGVRKKENFVSSNFMVLDFDEVGDQTLAEINHALQDTKRILATTRSHGIEKNGITCERFRLIVPWSQPITNLRDYEFNMLKAHEKYPWADKNALDGARFFFPCRKVLIEDREAIYSWDTSFTNTIFTDSVTRAKQSINEKVTGEIPFWCLGFINDGYIIKGSRNMTIFSVAYELYKQGFSEVDVRRFIKRAPIDWQGVNFEGCVKSARDKISWLKKGNQS